MRDFSASLPVSRSWRRAALALGLLAGPVAAQAQTSAIYGLGIFTTAYSGFTALGGPAYAAGAQVLSTLNPAAPTLAAFPTLITFQPGTASQLTGLQLVGLDIRPNTGQLYALGYDNSAASPANNAQLYVLNISSNTAVAVPVGNAVRLELGSSARTDLNGYNLAIGIGFDFNPRADRIRVTSLNQANYRLNPNTGAVVAMDAPLAYAATGNAVPPPTPPRIGAVAYSNAALGLAGTTLYDVDQTPNNGVLATQSIVSAGPVTTGTLTAVASLKLTSSGGSFGIGDANFDLDIYSDPSTRQNTAYLLELTGPTAASPGSTNLYTLNTSTGEATLAGNVVGRIPLRYTNIAAALAPAPDVWTGAVSTDWGTPGNWSTNMVPTASVDAFIPGPSAAVPNQPTVSGTAQQVRSVGLGAGSSGQPAVLTLASGSSLGVYGNFVNNDGSVAGSGTVALAGSAAQDITGQSLSQFPNLAVGASGATTSAPVAIRGGLLLAGNLAIGTGQPFTLLSGAAGTAYVVNNGGAIATGAATVQRYLDGSLNAQGIGYRHYSAPVTGTTLGDLATSTYSPVFNTAYNSSAAPYTVSPFPTVYGYSQAQYESSPATTINTDFERGYFSPTASTLWASGTAYTVNIPNSETVDFVGTLATGNYTVGSLARSAKANAGWQLLGNPYPSAIDWNVVQAASTGINNALYVYKSSGQYLGNYASYVNGVGTNGGTNVLPLAQGFFVRTATGQTGTVNFTNAARLNQPETVPFQRTAADARPQLLLALGDGTKTTQADVYFENGATPAFDPAFDAEAFPSSNGLVLASEISSNLLAINGLPELAGTVTVPLRVAVAAAGTYTLGAASLANLPAGYHAYLRDATLNTYTDLATTPSVAVSLAAGTATGRFAVVFGTSAPLATAPAALAALVAVYPNPAHGTAVLLLPATLRGAAASQVEVLNTLGQAVLRRTLPAGSADQLELPLSSLAAGIYTVRATTASGSVARQLRVE